MRNRFDFLRYLTKNCVRGINHILTLNHLCIPNRNNSVVAYSELQTTRNLILYNYDLLTQNSCLGSSKFDSVILSLPHHQNKSFFDVCGIGRALFKFAHQAFVKSGWRIIVRNILTNEKIDLGFIDADSNEHLLTDISLPNGDYEISVLTSSLFWQDAIDRKIRTFSTNENNNLSLPLIYDLRSLISNNITIIQWSTNQTAIDNCIFGIWYSPTSPVDINRQPDANILYKISQTEYQILLNQNKPLYILVAAMYASDKPIIGNTHELFLNWNSIPPRAPDDVVVLN
ncbi:MAG: hypothetical protein LBH59_01015 [Planctomycetaceae bacterium]|jgi:hypothetical protein|nr:hypothetical protein [Planctomycetaceae bacterium]